MLNIVSDDASIQMSIVVSKDVFRNFSRVFRIIPIVLHKIILNYNVISNVLPVRECSINEEKVEATEINV